MSQSLSLTLEQKVFLVNNAHIIRTSENKWYNCPFWFQQTGPYDFILHTATELPDVVLAAIKEIKEASNDMVIRLPSN